jgi:type IV pilus assembly protein PilM
MIRLTRTQLHPIGLDIGYDAVRMVQLEVLGRDTTAAVRAATRESFRDDDVRETTESRLAAAREAVGRMLSAAPFRGRRVVVALPSEMVHVKNYRLPPMPLPEIDSAARLEARNLFEFEPDDAHVQCLPAGEVRHGNDVLQEVIVLAVRNEDVDRYVEQIHACGLTVDSVDVEACALFRSIERFIRRREDEQEVHVLASVGLHATQIMIGRGREISFLKTIDIGSMRFHQAIATKLGISLGEARALRRRLLEGPEAPEGGASAEVPQQAPSTSQRDPVRQAVFDAMRSAMEQLARELSLCVRYQSVTFRGHRPTRVRLLGPEANDPHLQTILHSVLNIRVEAGRPLFNVDASRMREQDRRGTASEWATALGLALKRTTGRFAARDGRPRGSVVPVAAAGDAGETAAAAAAQAGAVDAEGEVTRARA